MLTTVPPLLPYSTEKLLFSGSRKESIEILGTRFPECRVVHVPLMHQLSRIFDLLRTITNTIIYHLSFNCQAKSLVQANLSRLGIASQSLDPLSAVGRNQLG
jgi:hypothetical protein